MHGGGWWAYIRYDEERDRPEISWQLIRRVANYARPYWAPAALMIGLIVLTTVIKLVPPLLFRDLIDTPANVEVTDTQVIVSFHRRAHLPIILASELAEKPFPVPWWDGRSLLLTTYSTTPSR